MLLRVLQIILVLFAVATGIYVYNFLQDAPQRTPYDRDNFGSSWYDADKNNCDTRNDVLYEQLIEPVVEGNCKVVGGVFINNYTGVRTNFKPGPMFPIDHIVSLKDAWESGAYRWSFEQRLQFANDRDNLLVTDQRTNTTKSDKGPDEWLPPKGVCNYINKYVIIKDKYGLEFSAEQDRAIQKTGCIK